MATTQDLGIRGLWRVRDVLLEAERAGYVDTNELLCPRCALREYVSAGGNREELDHMTRAEADLRIQSLTGLRPLVHVVPVEMWNRNLTKYSGYGSHREAAYCDSCGAILAEEWDEVSDGVRSLPSPELVWTQTLLFETPRTAYLDDFEVLCRSCAVLRFEEAGGDPRSLERASMVEDDALIEGLTGLEALVYVDVESSSTVRCDQCESVIIKPY